MIWVFYAPITIGHLPVRVTTAFNRLLGLSATWVQAVTLKPEAITVTVRLARRRLNCPTEDCGFSTRAIYDRRRDPTRWRHLDLCGRPLYIEAKLRRLACPHHGVHVEAVPFARPGARITRDYENLIVWCAASMDWTAASVLCRVSWRTVARVVERVVATKVDLARLEDLVRIGVDEISWKRGHKYLTLVIDHDTGQVIWGAKDRTAVTLEAFFDELGEVATKKLEAISMDFGAPYAKAVRAKAPQAAICLDPFHAVAMATKALDETRRDQWRTMRAEDPDTAAKFKGSRFVLLRNPENLTDTQAKQLRRIRRAGGAIWRAYQLKEALRSIYAAHDLSLDESIGLLDQWIARAPTLPAPQVRHPGQNPAAAHHRSHQHLALRHHQRPQRRHPLQDPRHLRPSPRLPPSRHRPRRHQPHLRTHPNPQPPPDRSMTPTPTSGEPQFAGTRRSLCPGAR